MNRKMPIAAFGTSPRWVVRLLIDLTGLIAAACAAQAGLIRSGIERAFTT